MPVTEPAATQPPNWASFVPTDLIDGDATLKLTFNWLKGHGTIPQPPDRADRLPEVIVLLVLTLALPAAMVWILCLFMDWRGAAWVGVVFALVMLLLIWMYDTVWVPRRAPEPVQRDPADLRAWKEARTKPEFWLGLAARNDQAGFTRECAELVAWIAQTREVRIANDRGRLDYGVSVFALGRHRVVAHTPLTFAERPVELIRDFAGSSRYFLARRSLLMSLKKVADGTEPVDRFRTHFRFDYVHVEQLTDFAKTAMFRPKGVPHRDDSH